jgi:hypothetical protein
MNIVTKYEKYSNPLLDDPDYANWRDKQTIFVVIHSFRDSLIVETINNLFSNAKEPMRIFVSAAISLYPSEDGEIAKQLKSIDENKLYPNTEIELVRSHGGPDIDSDKHNVWKFGALRKIAEKKYNNQDFYMIVDSSSNFDPHWDDILIKEWQTVSTLFNSNKFAFTCFPRKFMYNDFIIDGYSYYTNHKNKFSGQRQDYDGCTIPVSSFTEITSPQDYIDSSLGLMVNEEIEEMIKESNENSLFLNKHQFPKFHKRKFLENEFIAESRGFSNKFAFAKAKEYLKANPAHNDICYEHDDNMWSCMNLLENEFSILSLRWIPIYEILYLETLGEIKNTIEHSVLKNKKEDMEKSHEMIRKRIYINSHDDDPNKVFFFNNYFNIDWEKSLIKENKEHKYINPIIKAINSIISLYNFSVVENTLHWNKRKP